VDPIDDKLLIVSADNHGGPRPADLIPYVESEFRQDYELWIRASGEAGAASDDDAVPDARWRAEAKSFRDGLEASGRERALWDSPARLDAMSAEGIVAEVLYFFLDLPGLCISDQTDVRAESPLGRAVERGFHRWLADFVSLAPDTRAGQICLGFNDLADDLARIEWAATHGMRGLVIPSCDDRRPPHNHPRYEPIWAAAESNEMTLSLHASLGRWWDHRVVGGDALAGELIMTMEVSWWCRRPLWLMMLSGVFARHPRLRLVLAEMGTHWVPGVIRAMDSCTAGRSPRTMVDPGLLELLPRKPSDYWADQCYVVASPWTRSEVGLRGDVGVGNLMFGADFPHMEGTVGVTREWLAATIGGQDVTLDDLEAMAGLNACRAYGFDEEILRERAAAIGPPARDILSGSLRALPPSDRIRAIGARPRTALPSN
jgi:predicted TIM-barrel fold metal-dependent hydrolase